MPARNIDEVIAALSDIIEDAIATQSRLGYFAALYRTVTRRVRDDIAKGTVFQDNERMEHLDVIFANRYLDAHAAYLHGEPCSACWKLAFDAATDGKLIIVQDLLLGINAHINLDLGIAAATVAPGDEIDGLHHDFDRINQVLAELVPASVADVDEVSPWLGLLNLVGGRAEGQIINFSLDVARREAWRFATALARVDDGQPLIEARDRITTDLGDLVLKPGPVAATAIWLIRTREVKDVRRVIEVLAD